MSLSHWAWPQPIEASCQRAATEVRPTHATWQEFGGAWRRVPELPSGTVSYPCLMLAPQLVEGFPCGQPLVVLADCRSICLGFVLV